MAIVTLVGSGAWLNGHRIALDLKERSKAALARDGLTYVEPHVNGLTIDLIGPREDRKAAESAVRAVPGVRRTTWVDGPDFIVVRPLDLTVTVDHRVLRVRGKLPNHEYDGILLAAADEAFGDHSDVEVEFGTTTLKNVDVAMAATADIVRTLASTVRSAEMLVSDKEIDIDAECFTEAAEKQLDAALDRASSAGLKVKAGKKRTVRAGSPEDLQQSLDDLLGRAGINFETNSFTVDGPSQAVLATAVDVLQAFPESTVEIAGHADNRGSASTNMELSLQRAEAVARFLVDNGVANDRLTAKGYGDTMPIADNATPEGQRSNRRIEFHVKGTAQA
jgi:outer membrane protein OmpA-like peptidoglycan-associated protein